MGIVNKNRNFLPKKWGFEDWIDNRSEYCVKRMFLLKTKQIDWHSHPIQCETFYIWSGSIHLTFGTQIDIDKAEQRVLEAGHSFEIEPGMWHQITAFEDTWLFKVSTAHDDEDVIRAPIKE
jgi:mannose-6-phosphate isomerase-like protein (cupin superfamily)